MIEWALVSPAYNAAKDLVGWLRGKRKGISPEEIAKLRQRWKQEIEEKLRWIDGTVGYGEAIIRNVKQVDSYPDVDDKRKGISPWFKVGLLGTYHRGLQVGLRIEGLKYEEREGGYRYYDHSSGEDPDFNAYLVGLIPFDRIVRIDWEGDEHYWIPHVYCHFTSRGKEPYEDLIFCERRKLDRLVYYSEVAKYNEVRKLSKKFKKGHYA